MVLVLRLVIVLKLWVYDVFIWRYEGYLIFCLAETHTFPKTEKLLSAFSFHHWPAVVFGKNISVVFNCHPQCFPHVSFQQLSNRVISPSGHIFVNLWQIPVLHLCHHFQLCHDWTFVREVHVGVCTCVLKFMFETSSDKFVMGTNTMVFTHSFLLKVSLKLVQLKLCGFLSWLFACLW